MSALIFLTDLLTRPSQQRHGNSPLAVDRGQPCSDFAAGRHASEGPVLASLLPLAMCLQVSLTLSSTPLTDGLNLLTGGRTRVSNQSWHTLTFEFCTGIGTCDPHLEGPRRSTGTTALCSFPSAINHRWESQRSRAHRTVCSRPCRVVRKRSEFAVELDDIGFTVNGRHVCGYVQFRTRWLRFISECHGLWQAFC